MRTSVQWELIIEWKTGRRQQAGRYSDKQARDAHLKRIREDPGAVHKVEVLERRCTTVTVHEETFGD